VRLRPEGLTLAEIERRLRVGRQAVHAILARVAGAKENGGSAGA
jgi:hypothetical protein